MKLDLPPTIYDIARAAKVGIGTVSRVFNNHPSVSNGTRSRVLKVASRYNYQPHPMARGLARRRTNAILVYLPYFTSFFFVEILQSVQSVLGDAGFDLILHGVKHPGNAAESMQKPTTRGRVDGILFFSMKMPEEVLKEYERLSIPLVFVDTHHPAVDSYFVENVRGSRIVTEHLIEKGHVDIGMLNAVRDSSPARERLKGFRDALKEHDLPVNPEWIIHAPPGPLDGFTKESGYHAMKQLLALPKRPTAVVVSSDIQAIGALEAVREGNPKQKIAITGFDDIDLARYFELTTMRQPMSEMGALAANRLLERMQHPGLPPIQRSFVPELIVRKTSAVKAAEHVS